MPKEKRKKWHCVLLAISFCLNALIPDQALAFFSPSTLTLIANAAGSFIPAIIAFVAVVAVKLALLLPRFRQKSTNIFSRISSFLGISSAALLFVLGSILVGAIALRYGALKEVNRFHSAIDLTEDEPWTRFLDKLGVQPQSGYEGWFNEFKKIGLDTRSTFSLPAGDLQAAIYDSQYKVVGVHCSHLNIVNAIQGCKLGLEIMADPGNRQRIEELMGEYNLSKKDKIIVYCEGGSRSSWIALILGYHGYNVQWASFREVKDMDLIDFGFARGVPAKNIFIDILEPKEDEEYIYIILEEYILMDSQGNDLGIFLKDEKNLTPKNVTLLSALENGKIRSAPELLHISLTGGEHYMHLKWRVNSTEPFDTENFRNAKVICKDKFQCLVTKYYLEYLNTPYIDKIYCRSCTASQAGDGV